MWYTQQKSVLYSRKSITLFEAGYSSITIAQQLAIVILLGCLHLCFKNFPDIQKTKKNYTEIICVKHVTANPCISEDWLLTFWPIHREQEVCQIWDWWNINNISFHFRSFPRKTFEFSINFWKNPYKTIFEPIWSKMNFLGKEGSSSF